MPYPLADTRSRIRHRPQACKTCTRFSFAEKADYSRTIGTLQLGDCEKKTVEKTQGEPQKMEIRQLNVLIRHAPLPLLSVLRLPPEYAASFAAARRHPRATDLPQ